MNEFTRTPFDVPSKGDATAAIETQARWVLLFLLVSGLAWFLAGGVLFLIHSIQLHTPGFFARFEWFTFGRVQAAAESALVFGWVANAGFAVAWWLLGRLGAAQPKGLAAAFVGAFFWNAGVQIGIVGILVGDLGPYPLLQMPTYVVPLLAVAYAAFGTSALATWIDRKRKSLYAAQWYAFLAILALPWFYAAAYVMLSASPVTGVSQAIAAAWSGEGLRLLWIGALALAAAYYFTPKIVGETLPAYRAAIVGFWALVLFGPWVGTRALAGGPVPIWIPSVGISASLLLLLHFGVVAANFQSAFSKAEQSQALRFILLGVGTYLALGVGDTAMGFRSVAAFAQFTFIAEARFCLMIFGVVTPIVFGALYFVVPRIAGRGWASDGLIRAHYRAVWLGLLLIAIGLVGAGVSQAVGLVAERDPSGQIAAATFADIFETNRLWLLVASHGIGLQLLGGILLLTNAVLYCVPTSPTASDNAQPAAHTP